MTEQAYEYSAQPKAVRMSKKFRDPYQELMSHSIEKLHHKTLCMIEESLEEILMLP